MDIKVNPSLYGNVFAVPAAVVDDNIRLAGSASLKTLLWIMRNLQSSPTPKQASEALGLSVDDVNDALSYWSERGVLIIDRVCANQPSQPEKAETAEIEKTADKSELLKLKPSKKPDMAEVVKRGNESDEIKFLLNEAQRVMGRTLTNSDAETLLWLADYCEMPVSVILMAMNFAASRSSSEKNMLRMRYVEKIVLSWMDDEVFTVEAAENKIKEITEADSRWHRLQKLLGLECRRASAKEEELCAFIDEGGLPDDLISAAYNETVNKKGKYSAAYLLGILKRWREEGVKSASDITAGKQKPQNKKEATFSIDEYEKQALRTPKLKKNGKAVKK